MGIVELFLYIVIVAIIGYVAVWLLGALAPSHPAILDTLIWVVVVLLVLVIVISAFGLTGFDPRVPRLR